MPAARADKVDGPYEVNQTISQDEDFGGLPAHRFGKDGQRFAIAAPQPTAKHVATLHQGGIVLTQAGEWWGSR
jgi:xylan 1,4-beta-xylosidase